MDAPQIACAALFARSTPAFDDTYMKSKELKYDDRYHTLLNRRPG